jgi:hypothetical protein
MNTNGFSSAVPKVVRMPILYGSPQDITASVIGDTYVMLSWTPPLSFVTPHNYVVVCGNNNTTITTNEESNVVTSNYTTQVAPYSSNTSGTIQYWFGDIMNLDYNKQTILTTEESCTFQGLNRGTRYIFGVAAIYYGTSSTTTPYTWVKVTTKNSTSSSSTSSSSSSTTTTQSISESYEDAQITRTFQVDNSTSVRVVNLWGVNTPFIALGIQS